MPFDDLLADAKAFIAENALGNGIGLCEVPHLAITQSTASRTKTCSVVDPMIGLVLQGGKVVNFGSHQIACAAGDIVVLGQALPMVSGTINPTKDQPYVAIYLGLEMPILRNFYSELADQVNVAPASALDAGAADAEFIDAFARLFRLRRDSVALKALGNATLQEVYFWALRSQFSQPLHQIIHADSKANQIARAISYIRKKYREPIKADDLASIAGMSASVFYESFKKITSNSPLQYQKDLRLLEAHRMLQLSDSPVSRVAHSVGYESAAQFSREFSRKFGAPPTRFFDALTT